MSIDQNGALLYGFMVPLEATEQVNWQERFDRTLVDFDNIGYAVCDGSIYLTAFFKSVDQYEPVKRFPIAVDAEEYARWDGLLSGAARALKLGKHETPEWTLVYYED